MHLPRSLPPRLVSCLVFAAVAGTAFTGCQSFGHKPSPALKQGAAAASKIQASAELVSGARQQISRTTASLRNLVDRPGDTTAQYKVVLAEIAKMKADADKIAASVADARAQGDAYLAEWSRSIAAITNTELRDAAYARRADVSARLQALYKSYQDVQAAYVPFQKSLAEIQAVLGADLSAKGLASVKPFVAKATEDGYPLNAALGKLAEEFSAVAKALQPGGE